MPNIWAHIQFGKEVLTAIQEEGPMANPEWKASFQLGCQGPDFLFYDHFLPWQAATPLNRLGSQMHNVRCGPFLLSMFDVVRKRPIDDHAVAYAIGFLLHHILDRHLHPFVFSRSGFKKWHHQRYETAMDSVILMKRAGIHTGTTPVAPEINTGDRLPGGFAAEFLRIASYHYPVLAAQITPDRLDDAVAQLLTAQRLFFDPYGWKGKLTFGQLEPFSPPRLLPDWDVLNETLQPWIDPTDRTLIRTESAMDLWEHALTDAIATTAACIAWLNVETEANSAVPKARFAELLQDISYETGRPCGSGWITYADSVIPIK
ncbi:zinc dependent phospholipase C family protein [Cohnella silvisoli]|uniref:Zinc dependent phospholipase C family protein n=1 Tax=Cohnella silvisoli TaxID=2873699 RepID=A0ABV1KWG6_9BACL|nr:zinc dependent phospholipase C family protein [Cohnella silvisoli]MCD9024004.1 zinc dependent phospholipase C family protein [Cohnella silvisoli]